MKVIVLGGGSVGSQIAQQLIDDRYDVVVIEQDPEKARILTNRLDCTVLNKAGNSIEVLRQAGTETADVFVAVTGSDEVNMVACGLVASEFSVARRIARIRNISYSNAGMTARNFLGIDAIVNPEVEASRELIQSIEHGAMSDVIMFAHSALQIRNLPVPKGSVVIGQALMEAFRDIEVPFLVAAIYRDNDYLIPDGRTEIREDDILYMVGAQQDLEQVFGFFGKHRTSLDKVVIVGGGKAGVLLAEHLLQRSESAVAGQSFLRRLQGSMFRKSVVLVERDPKKCKQLSQQFPEALVVHADISEEGVFAEENLANSDLVLAVTDNQELNIVTALYARSLGIARSAVLVNNTNYTAVCSRLAIDAVTSVKQAVINSVLRNVKRSGAQSVHSLFDGRLEVLELTVGESAPIAGRALHAVKLPKDTLILSVSRGKQHLIPDGSYVPAPGDTIVVIGRSEHAAVIQAICTEGL
ncbi:Trk system potassium transporter TrkA [Spirochaeta africana]|uniref:Trk system potassium uptake protein TrkA n=1 Tax=Spirochaeta africana (strain ATCC 700263 / DSM 8902 / Z-7692) TaxID=889378 RepID=H9UGH5_SPIAZ|nr:Trk system potassium transporter TrkA [Spirochaeta africana]AFG36618.1 K+ transport system, NAD-binding component [Spirochaeta africana DSM 8902]